MRNHILMRIDPITDRLVRFDPKTNRPISPVGTSDAVSNPVSNPQPKPPHINAVGNMEHGAFVQASIESLEATTTWKTS